jgi:F0F1-type ATP synthase delta subunit
MSKVPPHAYAKAFLERAKGKSNEEAVRLVENLIALLKKNGDWSKRQQVVEACEKLWRRENGRTLITIESARPLESSHRQTIQKAYGAKQTDYEERIVSELVAGVRLTRNGEEQLDCSLAHILRALFPKT